MGLNKEYLKTWAEPELELKTQSSKILRLVAARLDLSLSLEASKAKKGTITLIIFAKKVSNEKSFKDDKLKEIKRFLQKLWSRRSLSGFFNVDKNLELH